MLRLPSSVSCHNSRQVLCAASQRILCRLGKPSPGVSAWPGFPAHGGFPHTRLVRGLVVGLAAWRGIAINTLQSAASPGASLMLPGEGLRACGAYRRQNPSGNETGLAGCGVFFFFTFHFVLNRSEYRNASIDLIPWVKV